MRFMNFKIESVVKIIGGCSLKVFSYSSAVLQNVTKQVVSVHVMKGHGGSKSLAPRILNLGASEGG
jgi:hypothetical protein